MLETTLRCIEIDVLNCLRSQQNLANILWAFAKVMIQPQPRAIDAVAEDALQSLHAGPPTSLKGL